MKNYKNIKLTPCFIVSIGYIYLFVISIFLYYIDFIHNNKFFRWGIPVTIFGKEITEWNTFYFVWFIILLNTAISTSFSEVVYAWMLNCIQDPKSIDTIYSKQTSIILIIAHTFYYTIHMLVFTNAIMTQFSFCLASFLGTIIVVIYTNWQYIQRVNENKKNLVNNSEKCLLEI